MINSYTGNVNSTALNYLQGVFPSGGIEYVLFPSGQYTTVIAFGDLEYSGARIYGNNCHITEYDQRGYSSGNSYYPTISTYTDSVNVNLGSSVAYSNVSPSLPHLEGQNIIMIGGVLCVSAIALCIGSLFSRLFNSVVLRLGGSHSYS